MLEKLLADAQRRKDTAAAPASSGGRTGPKFNVATFNAISPVGLQEFDPDYYNIMDMKSMLEAGTYVFRDGCTVSYFDNNVNIF